MNNGTVGYQLPSFANFINHSQSEVSLFRDLDISEQLTHVDEVDVQVRSGDYFVTLATVLDGMGSKIDSYEVRAELEDLVSDLIYLQDNYTISKSKFPKRQ